MGVRSPPVRRRVSPTRRARGEGRGGGVGEPLDESSYGSNRGPARPTAGGEPEEGGTGGSRRAVRARASGATRRGTRCAPAGGCVHGRQAVPLYVRTVHAAGRCRRQRPGRRRWCRAAARRLAGRRRGRRGGGGGGDSRVSERAGGKVVGGEVARWWAARWQLQGGGGRRHQWTAAGGRQRATRISKRVGEDGLVPRNLMSSLHRAPLSAGVGGGLRGLPGGHEWPFLSTVVVVERDLLPDGGTEGMRLTVDAIRG